MITQLSLGCVWISVGHPRILIEVGFGLRRGESQTKKVCDFSIFCTRFQTAIGLRCFWPFSLSKMPKSIAGQTSYTRCFTGGGNLKDLYTK